MRNRWYLVIGLEMAPLARAPHGWQLLTKQALLKGSSSIDIEGSHVYKPVHAHLHIFLIYISK